MGTLASELGPQVAALSTHPRIYVDANVPAGVVRHMRERLRWDVVSVVEDDALRRARDIEHYHMARTLRRTLITLDDDFLDDRRFPVSDSGGVIVLSAPNEAGFIRLVAKINRVFFARRRGRPRASPPLFGQKIHVHPDWKHPALARSRRRRSRTTKATKKSPTKTRR